MENQNEQQQKRRTAAVVAQDDGNQTERFGLWVGLGAAAIATIGVLALAFYTDYQANKKPEVAQEITVNEAHVGTVPASQAEAEHIALANSETQSKGMDAPQETTDDTAETEQTTATQLASEPASSPVATDSTSSHIAADEAQVVVEQGIVKFYFASGKSDLADNILPSLTEVVQGAKAGKKVVVSGFADSTGNAALNEHLSKERAFKVRAALVAAGIPENRIEMRKPQNTTGSGAKDEARRVEVVLE